MRGADAVKTLRTVIQNNLRTIIEFVVFWIGFLVARHSGGSDVEAAIFGAVVIVLMRPVNR
jgi:hypothetical protein